jgi:hypothetical protein
MFQDGIKLEKENSEEKKHAKHTDNISIINGNLFACNY